MKATLPYPPSTNVYWRVFRGRAVLSAEAKKYKATVKVLLAKHPILSGPVALTAYVYRPQRSGDLDNRLKVLGDALNGVIWADDKQVVEIHAYRHDDKANPRVEIEVTALAEDVAVPGPAEVAEGCVTAGCSSEARAGSLHCARHDVSKRLKPKPAVQSAHRAAKKMEEAMPKRPLGLGAAMLEAMSRPPSAEAEEDDFTYAMRKSRGVEGELQPLKAHRSCEVRFCRESALRGFSTCEKHRKFRHLPSPA